MAATAPTRRPGSPGVEAIELFKDDARGGTPGALGAGRQRRAAPAGGIELLVLEGGFSEDGDAFVAQSWLRLPVGDAAWKPRSGPTAVGYGSRRAICVGLRLLRRILETGVFSMADRS